MTYCCVNGILLNYEMKGSGEPLVLIQGMGNPLNLWSSFFPALAEHFQVFAFDNRGTGLSDMPNDGYSLAEFARDTAALMEELEIPAAHVLGYSMGGMIALQLARDFPQRVRSLVLAATSCRGMGAIAAPAMNAALDNHSLSQTERLRAMAPTLFSASTLQEHPEVVEEWMRLKQAFSQTAEAAAGQTRAARAFDGCSWLGSLSQSALVIGGADDLIFPRAEAETLAAGLPRSTLELVPSTGHLFYLEKPLETARLVAAFLH